MDGGKETIMQNSWEEKQNTMDNGALKAKGGGRDPWLDHLRGATLVSMILYHGCWDMVYLLGFDWNWYNGVGAWLWQQSICWTFILLSGYCWSLGRHPFKRGLIVFSAGLLVWLVTAIAIPSAVIRFGVLTLLGSSMLLMIPLEKLFRRVPASAGLIFSFLLFLAFRNTARGWLGIGLGGRLGGSALIALPEGLYQMGYFSAWLGFEPAGFFSTDYFPILPWFFLFCTGYFLWRRRAEKADGEKRSRAGEGSAAVERAWRSRMISRYGDVGLFQGLDWMGRHSLLVYLLHQPALYGIVVILDFVMN